MSAAAIKLDGIRAGSGGFRLGDIDLQLKTGETLALLGPSGSGKSTLLDLIAGFEPVRGGKIEIAGRDAATLAPEQRGIAYLMQALGLWEQQSALQNVAHVIKARCGKISAADLLDLVEFAADRAILVSELSGGERQRVGVARLLACRASLILLDEPGTHLDKISRALIAEVFRDQFNKEETSAIIVGHELDEILRYRPDRVALLDSGRLLQQGLTAEVMAAPASRSAAAMVGYETFLPGKTQDGEVACALGRFAATAGAGAEVLLCWRPGGIRLAKSGVPARVTARISTRQGPAVIVELNGGESLLALGSANGTDQHYVSCDAPTTVQKIEA